MLTRLKQFQCFVLVLLTMCDWLNHGDSLAESTLKISG